MHIPEEIIHAAGALPVVLWESQEPVTLGFRHIQPFYCGLARSYVDMAAKGKLEFLDGVVSSNQCLASRGMHFVTNANSFFGYLHSVYQPQDLDKSVSKDFLVEELERFRASLGRFIGNSITDESLQRSIKLYNEHRALLRKLYDLRRKNPAALKAKEVSAVVRSGMLMPIEEHNKLLQQLLSETTPTAAGRGKTRVFLSGTLCEAANNDILDSIEGAGGLVVDDDLYVGSRYFDTDVAVNGNPMEALAGRYLHKNLRCYTTVAAGRDPGDQLVQTVKKSRAKGVITVQAKYCDPCHFVYPDIKRKLEQAGIPELLLEVDSGSVSLERARIRVQAFIEMLGGR
jgi:bcr-type benzoyl-CoA reductase subunit C